MPESATRRLTDFHATLAEASLSGPRAFAEELVELVCETYGLVAASLYTFVPSARTLRLKAIHNLDLGLYANPELSLNTLAGSVIKTRNMPTRYVKDVIDHPEYRDQELARSRSLHDFVAVRIGVSDPDPRVPDPLGVLCCYGHDELSALDAMHQLELSAPYLARLYIAALERALLDLRKQTVEAVVWRRNLADACDASSNLLRDRLNCRSTSVLLFDRESKILRLVSSTSGRLMASQNRFTFPNSVATPNLPLYCFRSGQLLIKTNKRKKWVLGEPHSQPRPYFETMGYEVEDLNRLEDIDFEAVDPAKTVMLQPIFEASVPPGRQPLPIGVIRLTSLKSSLQPAEIINFSWEEVFVGNFAAEMLAVIASLHLRAGDYEYEFERRMHKARANLNSALVYLNTLEDERRFEGWSAHHFHYIEDTRAMISDLRWQIERGRMARAELDVRKVEMYSDVIAGMPKYLRQMAGEAELESNLNRLQEAGFPELPPVAGNVDALICVFTNLIENAVKYAGAERTLQVKLEIDAGVDSDGSVVIRVRDDGIGIPLEERAVIFDDGFRGNWARALAPDGLGKGLADCKAIIEKLGGSLALDASDDRTCFVVRLVPWSERSGHDGHTEGTRTVRL